MEQEFLRPILERYCSTHHEIFGIKGHMIVALASLDQEIFGTCLGSIGVHVFHMAVGDPLG